MLDFQEKYQGYLLSFKNYLNEYMQSMSTTPDVLSEAMKYSLNAGGKRIRPVLALATAELLNLPQEEILPYALALEMIHTYSLIHDDLPAMDNDDFRRGKPSNHKVFGEANAILAGDGLLNTAYAICFSQCKKGEKYVRAAQILCDCAGIHGMIAGQAADLSFTASQREMTEQDLIFIHRHKTGKLLLAPIAIASVLADDKGYYKLEKFAETLGVLFQITDDILDVEGDFEDMGKSIGKDSAEDKLTYVKLYGLDGAKARADLLAGDCRAFLEGIDGDTQFLYDLVCYVRDRKN